jgi:proteic killer suppression protein
MVERVVIGRQAQKQLRKVPEHIRDALLRWAGRVQAVGLAEVRKVAGYHDEPLSGDRTGQRSVRLNRGWRAFYVQRADGAVEFVEVVEVNHHDY